MQAEFISLVPRRAAQPTDGNEAIIGSLYGRWEGLSNWFPSKVVHKGNTYKSVEHAFQAAKAGAALGAAAAIRDAPTPKEAHALGQRLPLPADWERRRKPLMLTLLRDKFRRDAALRERLLKSESRDIIASNDWGEHFWGVCGGRGANELGKALCDVRLEIQSGADLDLWLRDAFDLADEEAVASCAGRVELEVRKRGQEGVVETLSLGSAPLVHFGKHSTCDVQLEHPSISRRHACLLHTSRAGDGESGGDGSDGGLFVVDLQSRAGLTLNGRRVPPLVAAGPLRDGHEIVFGGSSRTHVVRLRAVGAADELARLQEQHAKLRREIAQMEADSKDAANLYGLVAAEKRVDPRLTSCFLGNIAYSVTADTLREWLAGKGFTEVRGVRLPTDAESGAPKGIAFVEFPTAADAQRAKDALHGESLEGRTLKVDIAQPSTKRAAYGQHGREGHTGARSSSSDAAGGGGSSASGHAQKRARANHE